MTTNELLRQVLALDAKATPGPWFTADWSQDDGPNRTTIEGREPEKLFPGQSSQSSIWPNGVRKIRVAETAEGERPDDDAAIIVALRNNLPTIARALSVLAAVEEAEQGRYANESRGWTDQIASLIIERAAELLDAAKGTAT